MNNYITFGMIKILLVHLYSSYYLGLTVTFSLLYLFDRKLARHNVRTQNIERKSEVLRVYASDRDRADNSSRRGLRSLLQFLFNPLKNF